MASNNGNTRKTDEERGIARISFTVDPTLKRNMRIASAYDDKEVGEWAVGVLERAVAAALGKMATKARKK